MNCLFRERLYILKKRQSPIHIIGCLFVIFISAVEPAKILLLVPPFYSQCIQVASVGHALVERGHSVWAYVPNDSEIIDHCFDAKSIQFLRYSTGTSDLSDVLKVDAAAISKSGSVISFFAKLTQSFCSLALGDQTALEAVSEKKFDICLVNTMPAYRCFMLIPYKLKLPFVSVAAMHFWTDTGKPFLPNLEPYFFNGGPVRMSFIQVIRNAFDTIVMPFVTMWSLRSDLIKAFAPELSFMDYFLLTRSARIFIQDDDAILLGGLATLPNTVRTGGFSHSKPKPLPSNIQNFFNSKTTQQHGAILVSSGSFIDHQTDEIKKQFLKCFVSIKQSVLWKSTYRPENQASTNVMALKWIPQNDVLGNNKTLLFISHCGRRSFYEALFHAVPLLCIPVAIDQNTIASQVVYYGIGEKLGQDELSTNKIRETITRILSNQSYSDNIRHLSKVYRNLHPEPAGVVASRAIEHVIEYGGQHLQPVSMELSWVSIFMLDVGVLVGITVALFFLLVFCLCKVCYRSVSSRSTKSKQKAE